jgi:hypothetical protein
MFADPVPDGLGGTVELPSDLGNGKVLTEHLIDGATLDFRGVVRCFFRHGAIGETRGIGEKETIIPLSTDFKDD